MLNLIKNAISIKTLYGNLLQIAQLMIQGSLRIGEIDTLAKRKELNRVKKEVNLRLMLCGKGGCQLPIYILSRRRWCINYEASNKKQVSQQLTNEIGKGFSRSNLFNMRKFYTEYKNVQSLTGHLSWTHICELLIIEDKDKPSFYEKECANASWTIRELKRQIDSSLYERLLLSQGKASKEKVMELGYVGTIWE